MIAMHDADSDPRSGMTTSAASAPVDNPAPRKQLPPAAQRALAEAAERRAKAEAEAKARPPEFQGPKGPEPTRFGDWERKGIASDF